MKNRPFIHTIVHEQWSPEWKVKTKPTQPLTEDQKKSLWKTAWPKVESYFRFKLKCARVFDHTYYKEDAHNDAWVFFNCCLENFDQARTGDVSVDKDIEGPNEPKTLCWYFRMYSVLQLRSLISRVYSCKDPEFFNSSVKLNRKDLETLRHEREVSQHKSDEIDEINFCLDMKADVEEFIAEMTNIEIPTHTVDRVGLRRLLKISLNTERSARIHKVIPIKNTYSPELIRSIVTSSLYQFFLIYLYQAPFENWLKEKAVKHEQEKEAKAKLAQEIVLAPISKPKRKIWKAPVTKPGVSLCPPAKEGSKPLAKKDLFLRESTRNVLYADDVVRPVYEYFANGIEITRKLFSFMTRRKFITVRAVEFAAEYSRDKDIKAELSYFLTRLNERNSKQEESVR